MLPEMEEFVTHSDISLITLPVRGLPKEIVVVCVPK